MVFVSRPVAPAKWQGLNALVGLLVENPRWVLERSQDPVIQGVVIINLASPETTVKATREITDTETEQRNIYKDYLK